MYFFFLMFMGVFFELKLIEDWKVREFNDVIFIGQLYGVQSRVKKDRQRICKGKQEILSMQFNTVKMRDGR